MKEVKRMKRAKLKATIMTVIVIATMILSSVVAMAGTMGRG